MLPKPDRRIPFGVDFSESIRNLDNYSAFDSLSNPKRQLATLVRDRAPAPSVSYSAQEDYFPAAPGWSPLSPVF